MFVQSWGGSYAFENDCVCARAREGLYSCSPSPALPKGKVESTGRGVGEVEDGGIMLEATPMTKTMMTLTVPFDPELKTLTQTVHQPWSSLLRGPIISQSHVIFLHSYWPYFYILLLSCYYVY